jgi:hypothetical protein
MHAAECCTNDAQFLLVLFALVRAQQMKIVGYPVCIEDDKYHRNALLFNIGRDGVEIINLLHLVVVKNVALLSRRLRV